MHTIQKELIKRLILDNTLRYSDLTSGYTQDDNVAYHLKKLQKIGYVQHKEGKYSLTPHGITARTRFRLNQLDEPSFKTVYFGYVVRNNKDYLIKSHEHSKTPFYNLPGGKPLFGNLPTQVHTQIFKQETGIDVSSDRFTYDSTHFKTVVNSNGKALFDDIFLVYQVEVTDEQRKNMSFKRPHEWHTAISIQKLDNLWPEIPMCILRKNWNSYCEYQIISDYL